MKENSPICTMLKPPLIAVFSDCPESSIPIVAKVICPAIVTSVIMIIGTIYSISSPGTIIIPTETKNIAPKRSLSGVTIRSILTDSTVPARIDPAIKAPRADEKPRRLATTTIPRHIPTEIIIISSSFSSPFTRFSIVGMR